MKFILLAPRYYYDEDTLQHIIDVMTYNNAHKKVFIMCGTLVFIVVFGYVIVKIMEYVDNRKSNCKYAIKNSTDNEYFIGFLEGHIPLFSANIEKALLIKNKFEAKAILNKVQKLEVGQIELIKCDEGETNNEQS